jgi:hypothetical protein
MAWAQRSKTYLTEANAVKPHRRSFVKAESQAHVPLMAYQYNLSAICTSRGLLH